MKIEDLRTFIHSEIEYSPRDRAHSYRQEPAVFVSDLPPRRDAKADPPNHDGAVMVGWDTELVDVGHYVVDGFIRTTGAAFAVPPTWWCELLIPPHQEVKP